MTAPDTPAPTVETRPVPKPLAYLRLVRPKQWTKNLFVLSAVVFSGKWADPAAVLQVVLAAVAFVLASAAVYCLNDASDAVADRAHPKKRFRPVASGAVGVNEARILAMVLGVAALGLVTAINWPTLTVTAVYLAVNVAYSTTLKHLPLVDVLLIAGGFLLRVTAGCVAIPVDPSPWLLVCTAFLSLFMALVKRRQELARGPAAVEAQRKALSGYTLPLLDQFITATLATTVMTYLLYAHTVHRPLFMLTVLFVVYGLFRYLYLAHTGEKAERPEDALFSDVPLLAAVLLWGGSCAAFLQYEWMQARGG